jgi:hypothetical protein
VGFEGEISPYHGLLTRKAIDMTTLINLQVTGRIIIDAEAFENFNPHRAEGYDDLEDSDYTLSEIPAINETVASGYANEEEPPKVTLTEAAHLICKPNLLGYSMKLKKWRKYSTNIMKSTLR